MYLICPTWSRSWSIWSVLHDLDRDLSDISNLSEVRNVSAEESNSHHTACLCFLAKPYNTSYTISIHTRSLPRLAYQPSTFSLFQVCMVKRRLAVSRPITEGGLRFIGPFSSSVQVWLITPSMSQVTGFWILFPMWVVWLEQALHVVRWRSGILTPIG